MSRRQNVHTDDRSEAEEDRKVPEEGTPLTPEVNSIRVTGKKRRGRAGYMEHGSPRMLDTISRRGPSLFLTRNVPQLSRSEAASLPIQDGTGLSRSQQQDYFLQDGEGDEPQTPRESILKTPKVPPKLKHVSPLDLNGFDVTEAPWKSPLSVYHAATEYCCCNRETETPCRIDGKGEDLYREWL